ncbi:hypothetical protein [Hymenobacter metallicola]|uniref:Uncharacterized protein n=1 Tax=Hymenobacter metallicola TaxID=2563114 RepID=A0A4Z0QCM9_9BACT|nr:hypothetical protein [Hymenobacter metallicola]TGE26903.1 hypothetical protein E5K02_10880 [Hymenobacter metallicola]
MALLTPDAFLNKWKDRFADNDTFEIDEADLREFSADIKDSFVFLRDLHTNKVRGSLKIVRDLDFRAALPLSVLTIGTPCTVLNAVTGEEDDAGKVVGIKNYVLVTASSDDPDRLLLPADPIINLGINAVKWVLADSKEAALPNVSYFDPNRAKYELGETVKFSLNGYVDFYEPKLQLVKPAGGTIPAPISGLDNDANWRLVGGLSPSPLYSNVTWAQLYQLQGEEAFGPGRVYFKYDPTGAMPVVRLEALDGARLDLKNARQFNADYGTWDRGTFDLYNDQFVPDPIGEVSNTQARRIRPLEPAVSYTSVELANEEADYGDTVEAVGTGQVPTLVLRGGVTYATKGLMVNWNLLTDNGNKVITCKVVGNSPEGRYGGGAISVTGVDSDIIVEKDLFPDFGNAVYQTNGTLTHRGKLRGNGSSQTMLYSRGGVFRHLAGPVRLGGSVGFDVAGTADVLIKADTEILQAFHRLVDCSGAAAKIRIEGGSRYTGPSYAAGYVVVLTAGEVTLANGTYDNTLSNTAGAQLSGGTLILDKGTLVGNIVGSGGTVMLRNGGKCLGAISADIVVVNQNGDSGEPVDLSDYYTKVQVDGKVATVRTTIAQSTLKAADYTLDLADAGNIVPVNAGAAVTVWVPTDAAANFPVGTVLEIEQQGAGQVTVAAGAGVTLNGYGGLKTAGQYASVGLRKVAANTWILKGGVA